MKAPIGEAMPPQPIPRPKHWIFTNARSEAFAGSTKIILGRLGYAIVSAQQLDELGGIVGEGDAQRSALELLILDEHRLEAMDEIDPGGTLPIVLLTGRAGIREPNPRFIAAVKRPAGLHDLYRIFQQHFEECPRTTPRVETTLEATCQRRGKTWSAAVRSLSDNGCLLRSDEAIPLGSTLEIALDLPNVGVIEFEAESAYQLVPDLGLVFSAIAPQTREAIGAYVIDALAAG